MTTQSEAPGEASGDAPTGLDPAEPRVVLSLNGSRIVTAAGDPDALLGVASAELVGTDLLDLIDPADHVAVASLSAAQSDGAARTRLVARLARPTADHRAIAILFQVATTNGAISEVTATLSAPPSGTDPTRLGALFARPDTIVLVCNDHRILSVTPASKDLLGWTPAELLTGYLEILHPDDLATTVELSALVTNSPGTVVSQVGRLRHADGTYRTIESRAINLLDDPGYRATFVTMQEVPQAASAAHEARSVSRFQAMVNQAADPILVLSPTGQITYVSPAMGLLLRRPATDLLSTFARDVVHPDDVEALGAWYGELLASPGESATTRLRLLRDPDDPVWVEVRVTNFVQDATLQGVLASVRDISATVVVEEELRASEARFREREQWYRALVQHSFELTVVTDPDLTLRWVSPSAEEMLGWIPDDVVGHGALEFVHPDDHEMVAEHLALVLEGVSPRPNTTLRVIQHDGDHRYVDVSAADRSDDPAVRGFIINLRDASQRVAAEEALSRSERRYRQLVQNSTDVVQIMSPTGEVLWVSPAVETVLGWAPEEVLGHPTGGMSGFAGRDQALATFLQVLDEPGATGRTVCQVRHADGTMRWIDLALVNQLGEPDIDGIVATFRDITERVTIEEARRESEERFRSLANSSPLGIFQFDLDTNCVFVNDRWSEIVGYPAEEGMGQGWRHIMLPEQAALLEEGGVDLEATTGSLSIRGRFRRGDGRLRWADIRTAPLTDDQGNRVGTVGTIDDVTDRVEAQRETELLTTILESTPDLVGISDRTGTTLYLNEAARHFFGLDHERDLSSTDLSTFFPLEAIERWQAEVQPSLKARDIWQGELTLLDREGRAVPVSAVVVAHRGPDRHIEQISANARDISDRKALEARLEHEATHDPLTGLPNRTLLLDRLEVAIGRAQRQHRRLAVLFLDLDHFKVVNDSLGHSTGDQLLAAIAARLIDHVRPGDTVARFGGDEFVVVCEEVESVYEVEEIAERISGAVAEAVWIGDSEVFVTSSIGIALASDLHQTPEQLLRDADAAMYQAKARGRSRHEVFDSRLRTRALDRLEVESALRRALVRHELRVHYQPCFELATGAVTGVEALLRWEHPTRGLLLPAEFLRVAEETGLIVPVGAWVARQACRQIQRLRVELPQYESMQVAVNLSARQISHPYLVDEIAKVLSDTGTRPDTLVLEITESVLMDDVPTNAATLRRLKALGVSLAIDDFGTGYSSLAYLRRFPVDILKVDRSFVTGLGNDPEDAAIANAVITLAHTLGLIALAEGVESTVQQSELARLNCDQAQGFLLGRPMSAADLTDFLVSRDRVG